MLAFELDKNLDTIVGRSNLTELVYILITTAEAQGWLGNLIDAARKFNPANLRLKAIAEELLPNHYPGQSIQQQKILILAAIPDGLRLDREIRKIEECIRRAVRRDMFEVDIRTAVRPQDIRRAIAEETPQIVHFCGHGLKDGSLLLEDEGGRNKAVSPEGLASLFKLHADYVNCVVLNGGYSTKTAEAISQYINYVIGINQPIEDKAAIQFAQGFYDGLGYETSPNQDGFQRAFEEGLVAIELESLSQDQIPVIKTRINIRSRVFISYRSKDPDLSLAQLFYKGIKAAGHEAFMAEESIRLGENLPERIDKELERCDYFLLLLSPKSATSEMVTEEVRRAKQLQDLRPDHKPLILPIRVNFPLSAPLNYDLRGYLSQIQQREWKSPADTPKTLQEILTILEHPPLPVTEPELPAEPELPEGQTDLTSAFYVERPPIESQCYEEILKAGSLIYIKAPRKMGKSSLMARILYQASQQGCLTVPLSFQLADGKVFADLDKFLQWFCASVGRRLRISNKLGDYWDEIFGSKDNCTAYFEEYLLAEINQPLVLGLDEVDLVFQHPEIAADFFGLLRAWHEDGKNREIWKKLRLIVVHSTEVYIPMNIYQSPFNIGLSIELPEFNVEQVLNLAQRHGLNWNSTQVEQLMGMVGGYPYLVRMALYEIARQKTTLEQLLDIAPTEAGLYSDYLRRHLWNLEQHPELAAGVKQIVATTAPVHLEPIQAFRLKSMGLVKLLGNDCVPSCDLYRQYFSRRYFSEPLVNHYFYSISLTTSQASVSLGLEIEVLISLKSFTASNNNDYVLQIPQYQAAGSELNIILVTSGFQLEGDNTTSLPLDPDTAQETQTARFRLTALRPGSATIIAELYRGDTFETKLETQIQVANIDEATFTPHRITTQPRPVPQPDFILRIQTIWNETNSTCKLQYQLKSFRFLSVFSGNNIYTSESLSSSWIEQVRGLLATTLENISGSLPTEGKSRLISLGQYLFGQVLPTELQTDFRSLIPQNSTFTLLVLADQEAWIPWELLHEGQKFLGDRFIIGRWLQELNDTRPYEFPVGAVNVAHYANVEQPQLWSTLLEAPGTPPPQPLPAGVLHDSTEAMRGLHLIRYSQSSDADLRNAPVTLDNINHTEDIELQMRPAKLNLRRNRPFVTLSYVKTDTPELTALENTWASAFIRAGCSGFTGSLWAVEPAVEAAFISCFYSSLWAGASLGEAFYTSRQLARVAAPDSLDWLAYVLFGDPMARPYRPVPGDGYAIVEPIGREIDDPLPPGAIARFRVTLRKNPPIWHEDRVIEVAENLVFENLQVHIVTYGLQVIPDLPVTMTLIAKGDYLGWFTLVVPNEITETSPLVQVYFADGMRPIHSLNFSLKIENRREE
ncbi:AAA-like domain-containing protein [Calothrix anomala FACHB-343]|uniref:AAA-like domain-containing protein n=3 Tax=Calotrichaceae TaxID=2661849 RepID=A0ABR8ANF8_9CYAN|nr:AAA-like domain-containing protein [Calothrix parietina FACHB-288]MBD2229796.1 AAA-like domain-containing protein [Calothrix anomala FACHB-343]